MARITIEARNNAERRVLAHLEANIDDRLADKINRCGKSLSDAMRHAGDEARKAAGGAGGCVCAEDGDVYNWVIGYFEGLPEPEPAPFDGLDLTGLEAAP